MVVPRQGSGADRPELLPQVGRAEAAAAAAAAPSSGTGGNTRKKAMEPEKGAASHLREDAEAQVRKGSSFGLPLALLEGRAVGSSSSSRAAAAAAAAEQQQQQQQQQQQAAAAAAQLHQRQEQQQ